MIQHQKNHHVADPKNIPTKNPTESLSTVKSTEKPMIKAIKSKIVTGSTIARKKTEKNAFIA